jgi:hypothetical protein
LQRMEALRALFILFHKDAPTAERGELFLWATGSIETALFCAACATLMSEHPYPTAPLPADVHRVAGRLLAQRRAQAAYAERNVPEPESLSFVEMQALAEAETRPMLRRIWPGILAARRIFERRQAPALPAEIDRRAGSLVRVGGSVPTAAEVSSPSLGGSDR